MVPKRGKNIPTQNQAPGEEQQNQKVQDKAGCERFGENCDGDVDIDDESDDNVRKGEPEHVVRDEAQTDEHLQASGQSKKHLNELLMTYAVPIQDCALRSLTTILGRENILATYRPSYSAMPQADEKAARIFRHFVSCTAPCMTIFERDTSERYPTLGHSTVSAHRQPLWIYTLPSLALDHPALMHAILALAALHIANLQHTSPSPSMKHFAYALRRLGRLIGLPQRRNEVTTFAATLLLGFYEMMGGETSKWNIHLAGAKILAMEIDFAGKTRQIRAYRAQMKKYLKHLKSEHHAAFVQENRVPASLIPDCDWEVDEDLVSALTGYPIRYDYHCQTGVGRASQTLPFALTAREVDLYKMQADLYWWYAKQDIFQSMISGNNLLMPYDHWIFCPPRGRLGHPDLVYATMDHLCLIMARLANFGARDQNRKRRTMAMYGAPTPQKSGESDKSAPSGPGPPSETEKAPPTGYMPAPGGAQTMHSALESMNANLHDTAFRQSPAGSPGVTEPLSYEALNLDVQAADATEEYTAISKAFDRFNSLLPVEYQALPPGTARPIPTPFGPAIQYRTHTIACMWTFYYAGRILHARLHPAMPPAAMISAQAASAKTTEWSQIMGKICGGLFDPQQFNQRAGCLNPSLGGAMIEGCFGLFFAAVQFVDPVQRGWTISKLCEITSVSGWQTGAAVAAGCEFAWQAMGQAQRGPSYRPTMDWRVPDDRIGDKVMKRAAKEAAAAQEKMTQGRQQEAAQEQQVADGRADNSSNVENYDTAVNEHGETFAANTRPSPTSDQPKAASKLNAKDQNHQHAAAPAANNHESSSAAFEFGPITSSHDRETIGTNRYARAHWALGLLALEEDLAKMAIDD